MVRNRLLAVNITITAEYRILKFFMTFVIGARSIEADASKPLDYSDLRSESYAGLGCWLICAFFGGVCVLIPAT